MFSISGLKLDTVLITWLAAEIAIYFLLNYLHLAAYSKAVACPATVDLLIQ